jgi:hypothetical protein
MADIFAPILSKLVNLGFFNFLIFILAMVLIYALLRQRKIFGENPLINGLIAFSIAFFVFAYPILGGVSLVFPLTTFLSQAFVFVLVLFIGFLLASFFYPNFPEVLGRFFQTRGALAGLIALAVALFVTSGLVSIIYTAISPPSAQRGPSTPPENMLLIAGLILAVVILLLAGSVRGGGG